MEGSQPSNQDADSIMQTTRNQPESSLTPSPNESRTESEKKEADETAAPSSTLIQSSINPPPNDSDSVQDQQSTSNTNGNEDQNESFISISHSVQTSSSTPSTTTSSPPPTSATATSKTITKQGSSEIDQSEQSSSSNQFDPTTARDGDKNQETESKAEEEPRPLDSLPESTDSSSTTAAPQQIVQDSTTSSAVKSREESRYQEGLTTSTNIDAILNNPPSSSSTETSILDPEKERRSLMDSLKEKEEGQILDPIDSKHPKYRFSSNSSSSNNSNGRLNGGSKEDLESSEEEEGALQVDENGEVIDEDEGEEKEEDVSFRSSNSNSNHHKSTKSEKEHRNSFSTFPRDRDRDRLVNSAPLSRHSSIPNSSTSSSNGLSTSNSNNNWGSRSYVSSDGYRTSNSNGRDRDRDWERERDPSSSSNRERLPSNSNRSNLSSSIPLSGPNALPSNTNVGSSSSFERRATNPSSSLSISTRDRDREREREREARSPIQRSWGTAGGGGRDSHGNRHGWSGRTASWSNTGDSDYAGGSNGSRDRERDRGERRFTESSGSNHRRRSEERDVSTSSIPPRTRSPANSDSGTLDRDRRSNPTSIQRSQGLNHSSHSVPGSASNSPTMSSYPRRFSPGRSRVNSELDSDLGRRHSNEDSRTKTSIDERDSRREDVNSRDRDPQPSNATSELQDVEMQDVRHDEVPSHSRSLREEEERRQQQLAQERETERENEQLRLRAEEEAERRRRSEAEAEEARKLDAMARAHVLATEREEALIKLEIEEAAREREAERLREEERQRERERERQLAQKLKEEQLSRQRIEDQESSKKLLSNSMDVDPQLNKESKPSLIQGVGVTASEKPPPASLPKTETIGPETPQDTGPLPSPSLVSANAPPPQVTSVPVSLGSPPPTTATKASPTSDDQDSMQVDDAASEPKNQDEREDIVRASIKRALDLYQSHEIDWDRKIKAENRNLAKTTTLDVLVSAIHGPPIEIDEKLWKEEDDPEVEKVRRRIEMEVSEREKRLAEKVAGLRDQYKSLNEEWEVHCARLDRISERREQQRRPALPTSTSASTPGGINGPSNVNNSAVEETAVLGLQHPSSTRSNRRNMQAGFGGFGDAVRSEAEFLEILASLESADMQDPTMRAARTTAAIPEMLVNPDSDEPLLNDYDDENGFVADPVNFFFCDFEKVFWTEEEKTIFEKRYVLFPKQFGKISQGLPDKTASQCVSYYYLNKKKPGCDFKSMANSRNKTGGKKKTRLMKPKKAKGSALMADLKSARDDEDEEEENENSNDINRNQTLQEPVRRRGRPSLNSIDASLGRLDEEDETPTSASGSRKRRAMEDDSPGGMELEDRRMKPFGRGGKRSKGEKRSKVSARDGTDSPSVESPSGNSPGQLNETDMAAIEASGEGKKKRKGKGSVTVSGTPSVFGEGEEGPKKARPATSSYWSVAERTEFLKALIINGKDWVSIASCLSTKSAAQARNFFGRNSEEADFVEAASLAEENSKENIETKTSVAQAYVSRRFAVEEGMNSATSTSFLNNSKSGPRPGIFHSSRSTPSVPMSARSNINDPPGNGPAFPSRGLHINSLLNEEKPTETRRSSLQDWFGPNRGANPTSTPIGNGDDTDEEDDGRGRMSRSPVNHSHPREGFFPQSTSHIPPYSHHQYGPPQQQQQQHYQHQHPHSHHHQIAPPPPPPPAPSQHHHSWSSDARPSSAGSMTTSMPPPSAFQRELVNRDRSSMGYPSSYRMPSSVAYPSSNETSHRIYSAPSPLPSPMSAPPSRHHSRSPETVLSRGGGRSPPPQSRSPSPYDQHQRNMPGNWASQQSRPGSAPLLIDPNNSRFSNSPSNSMISPGSGGGGYQQGHSLAAHQRGPPSPFGSAPLPSPGSGLRNPTSIGFDKPSPLGGGRFGGPPSSSPFNDSPSSNPHGGRDYFPNPASQSHRNGFPPQHQPPQLPLPSRSMSGGNHHQQQQQQNQSGLPLPPKLPGPPSR